MTIKEIFDEIKKEQFLSLENASWCNFTKKELEDMYDSRVEKTKEWFRKIAEIQPEDIFK